ncbi:MAG TPA: FAD-dependent oxidoreductase [Burkholderiaceae bacterium]|jgi:predicted NAD/FAD-binding protein|nr:FAD-dependent oxidoreductase [Burkholderiaceae bacterium]
MKIAVVGSGIAGNVAAHALHGEGHELTVFEAESHIGGHTHTHRIELDGEVHAIDTGFIVFNDWTYPNFIGLLDRLGIATQPTTMSFSVRNDARGLEYNGTSLDGLFAQRRNLLRPSFLRMIGEIVRFNREAPRLLERAGDELALGEFLAQGRYGQHFVDDYLVPMGAAIWSTDPARMMAFPARFFVQFLHNHGMLSIDERPTWRVVTGGSARYVERLALPWRHRVRLDTPVESVRRLPHGVLVAARGLAAERFDHVFLACHADQALRLLADPTPQERAVLGALPYQSNEAVLHTDTSLLPRNRRAWAAWNYHVGGQPDGRVALTYDMNALQGLRSRHTFCVTLNATERIDPAKILRRLDYAHPLFTPQAIAAQARHKEISGVDRTHYCGAYWRHGFHEDGVVSALQALELFEANAHAQRDLYRVA